MSDPTEALTRMRLAGFRVEADHHGGLRIHPAGRLNAEQRAFVEANHHALECAVLREAMQRQSEAMREAAREMAEMRGELEEYQELVMLLEHCLKMRDGRGNDSSAGGTAIPAQMLRRLIQLCHPDRHDGSEASRKATTFLLGLRENRESD